MKSTITNDMIQQLQLLAAGRLRGAGKAAVETALERDADLAATYEVVKSLVKTGRRYRGERLRNVAAELAQNMFRDLRAREGNARIPRGVRVYDSQGMPLPEGVRPSAVETRSLRFRFDGVETELTVYPLTPDSIEVIGQINGLDSSADVVVELRQGRRTFRSRADECGLFRFPRVPQGSYTVSVRQGDVIAGVFELTT